MFRILQKVSFLKPPFRNYMFFSTSKKSKKTPILTEIKAGISPYLPKKIVLFISETESPLKVTKNAFYFILKALFVLQVFKFLC